MTKDEARKILIRAAVKANNLTAEAQEAFINTEVPKVVALIDPAQRGNYDDDDTIAAAEYYDIYKRAVGASDDAGDATGIVAETKKAASKKLTFVAPELDDTLNESIAHVAQENVADKLERGKKTKIAKLTLKNPPLKAIFDQMGVHDATPMYDDEKINEWEKALYDNAATADKDGFNSVKNFAKLKAANKKTPLPLYFADSKSVQGCEIETPADSTDGKGQTEKRELSIGELKGFLLTKVLNTIGINDENGLAVQINKIVTREDNSAAQAMGGAKKMQHSILLKWNGKADVLKAEKSQYINYVNRAKMEGNKIVKSETPKACRLDCPFKIKKSVTVDSLVKERIQTVRPVAKATAPVFERAGKEMLEAFGPDKAAPISANKNWAEQQEIVELQRESLSAIISGDAGSVASFGFDLGQVVASIKDNAKKGSLQTNELFAD